MVLSVQTVSCSSSFPRGWCDEEQNISFHLMKLAASLMEIMRKGYNR